MGTDVGDERLASVSVVLDQPRRRSILRLRGRVGALVGGFLATLGFLATASALVYTGVWIFTGETEDRDVQTENLARLAAVWGAAGILIWLGRMGQRLMRGNRRLVLFLRRFGHAEAIDAVSFACQRIGRRWRLITLDDAAIAPVALTPALARTAGAAHQLRERLRRLAKRLFRIGLVTAVISISALGLIFLIVPDEDIPTELSFPPHSLMGFLFWPFAGAFLAVFIATGIAMAVGAVLLPLRGLNPLLDAVVDAEGSATAQVRTTTDIDAATRMVAEQTRRVFSPKLIVFTVESPIWQATVRRLATTAAVTLVDVSRPTDHLIWEIDELTTRLGTDCVFVGHLDRLRRYTRGPGVEVLATPKGSVLDRLDRHLEGREILAYTTDSAGLTRFARALHARLEAGPDRTRRRTRR